MQIWSGAVNSNGCLVVLEKIWQIRSRGDNIASDSAMTKEL